MAEAIKWFEKAANQENTDALFMLGAIYQNGMGVSVNLNKAANLYQKASNKGDIAATRELGTMYLLGNGVVKNPRKSSLSFYPSCE